ncbi:MAG: hypothetical protein PW792_12405 [Acidobacteriaceae bacterium]|nr:hypothetical protein [Acidobacteriaceae bacterium]
MRLALAVALLSMSGFAHAQATTWHNLHFGETRDQVRTDLTAQGIPVESSAEGALQSTSDYDLFLPGLTNTLPLRSSYHFTPNGGLMDVTLTLDLPAMRRNFAELASDDALIRFASDAMAGALAGRYGAPIYRSPACEGESKEANTCAIFWNGSEQSILLERTASPRGQHLLLRYQMLTSDL